MDVRLAAMLLVGWFSAVVAADWRDTPRDLSNLQFEGNQRVPSDLIIEALVKTPVIIAATERATPADTFCQFVAAAITYGYHAGGFPEVHVTVTGDEADESWKVAIDEGPRFFSAPVEFQGPEATVNWLRRAWETRHDHSRHPATDPIWTPGKSVSFFFLNRDGPQNNVSKWLASIGLPPWAVRVETRRLTGEAAEQQDLPGDDSQPDDGMVQLVLTVVDGQLPPKISTIDQQPPLPPRAAATLDEIGLVAGELFDVSKLDEAQRKLMKTGELQSAEVHWQAGAAPGDVAIEINTMPFENADGKSKESVKWVIGAWEELFGDPSQDVPLTSTTWNESRTTIFYIDATLVAASYDASDVGTVDAAMQKSSGQLVVQLSDKPFSLQLPHLRLGERWEMKPEEDRCLKTTFNIAFHTDRDKAVPSRLEFSLETWLKLLPPDEVQVEPLAVGFRVRGPRTELLLDDEKKFQRLTYQNEEVRHELRRGSEDRDRWVALSKETSAPLLANVFPRGFQSPNEGGRRKTFDIPPRMDGANVVPWMVLRFREDESFVVEDSVADQLLMTYVVAAQGDRNVTSQRLQRHLINEPWGPLTTLLAAELAIRYADRDTAQLALTLARERSKHADGIRRDLDAWLTTEHVVGRILSDVDPHLVSCLLNQFSQNELVGLVHRMVPEGELEQMRGADGWESLTRVLWPSLIIPRFEERLTQLESKLPRNAVTQDHVAWRTTDTTKNEKKKDTSQKSQTSFADGVLQRLDERPGVRTK